MYTILSKMVASYNLQEFAYLSHLIMNNLPQCMASALLMVSYNNLNSFSEQDSEEK